MNKIVIIPTYNEKKNIQKIIPAVLKLNLGLDILVVDDNSPDNTSQIVKQLAAKIQDTRYKIQVLNRKNKEGLGRAYLAGFKWALNKGYKVIIQMDADFSHHPKYLKTILKEIKTNDLVIGSRYVKEGGTQGWGWNRKILSRGGSLYAKTILGSKINDLTGGFKCWRQELLKKISLNTIKSNGYSFQIEMNFRAEQQRARIKEIPIIFVERDMGESKMSKKIIWEAIWKVWQLRLGTNGKIIN